MLIVMLALAGQPKLIMAIGKFELALLNLPRAILQLLNRLGGDSGQSEWIQSCGQPESGSVPGPARSANDVCAVGSDHQRQQRPGA
jgi:hypothetical protein